MNMRVCVCVMIEWFSLQIHRVWQQWWSMESSCTHWRCPLSGWNTRSTCQRKAMWLVCVCCLLMSVSSSLALSVVVYLDDVLLSSPTQHSKVLYLLGCSSPEFLPATVIHTFSSLPLFMADCWLCWPPAILFYCCSLDLILFLPSNLRGCWLIITKLCDMFDSDPGL